ncbi:TVP38/TMEM64 family protein [Spirochaeta lutea]|uniref:TVP38/TMEM64 family protein n=1 Tax=Spirochaeta lutea TaxID=1480694 RepID=UPI00068F8D35|nr:VTT domain-containing protein [Spirochaeta lutea]
MNDEKKPGVSHRGARIVKGLAFPVILLGITVVGIVHRETLFSVFTDQQAMEEILVKAGWQAPFLYMAVQIIQVFVFIVPGDVVQFAGGYLFGVFGGMAYSLLGILIGSGINFLLARWLGRAFVESLFNPQAVQRFETILASPRAQTGFFLLFLIPGLPGKDLLCYVAGISKLRFGMFLLISMAARLPGILGSSIMGGAVSGGQYGIAIAALALAVLLFGFGFIYRKKIHQWIEMRIHKSDQ